MFQELVLCMEDSSDFFFFLETRSHAAHYVARLCWLGAPSHPPAEASQELK